MLFRTTVLLLGLATLGGCSRTPIPPLGSGAVARCIARSRTVPEQLEHTLIIADYSSSGRLVRLEHRYLEDPIDERRAVQKFRYSATGRLTTRRMTEYADGEHATTIERYAHDDRGRIVRIEPFDDSPTTVDYDERGHTITFVGDGRSEAFRTRVDETPSLRTTTYSVGRPDAHTFVEELDARGHVVRAVRHEGSHTHESRFVYDDAGRVIEESHGPESVERYERTRGRLVRSTLLYDGQPSLVTTYTYTSGFQHDDCVVVPKIRP